MTTLPEPEMQQPTAHRAGQPINPAATAFLADIEDALAQAARPVKAVPTSFRDDTLPSKPTIGLTPPVTQPGRPAMSETATNVSGVMIASSVPILALGGAATGILWASGHADPTVIACIAAAPISLAVPILALSRLVKRVKQAAEAAPPVIHQHYNGNVHHDTRTVHSTTRGFIASTRNQLPAGE